MKNKLLPLLIGAYVTLAMPSFATDDERMRVIKDTLKNSGHELGSYTITARKGQARTSVQCIDGLKFAVVVIIGHQSAESPSADIVQVYENRGQGNEPARCE